MLKLIGGWGDRAETPRSCAERVQLSWQLMPSQPDTYGPWGVWVSGEDRQRRVLVPINDADPEAIEAAIVAETERVNEGPRTAPGHYIEFTREVLGERPETSPRYFQYYARAGFVESARPMNHLLMELDADTQPDQARTYLIALVRAWRPEHLAVVGDTTLKEQRHKPPQVRVGWLTYIRDATTLDTMMLGEQITVTEADDGRYLTLSGSPTDPELYSVLLVRRALGYPDA
ncbi:hypothetical protein [Mycobacterium branderi]|uniref:Immunity protein 52 domain-containing protein n=1 Tax=Mycobacterium branderi TaxID=43348 RepID=A0A7I7WDX9_9MYCO|nr:hypothetical protein [Mycobacterium branderi]MCV7235262.1 hypothetical protein [Mycobacterium branderi]ORA29859.1 hypothetical protein BST20_27800 [Mycobacterium branderi]BBZ15035.1 hypothetical protein MBRA_52300 [Mycobacterium branderi]